MKELAKQCMMLLDLKANPRVAGKDEMLELSENSFIKHK